MKKLPVFFIPVLLLWGCSKKSPTGPTSPTLQVFTQPAGATLLLDGQDKGKTPCTVSGLSFSRHEIQVLLMNYLTQSESIDIARVETIRKDFQFFPAGHTEVWGDDAYGWRSDTVFYAPVESTYTYLHLHATPPVPETLGNESWFNNTRESITTLVLSEQDSVMIIVRHDPQPRLGTYKEKFYWVHGASISLTPIAEAKFTISSK